MSARRAGIVGFGLIVAIVAIAPPVHAGTRLNGEYQLMADLRKNQRWFPWDWESNNGEEYTGLNLKLTSNPRANIETFVRFEADWDPTTNGGPRPLFLFRDAYMRYTLLHNNRKIETYLFSREDRFWMDNYLLRLVDGGSFDAGGSQGVRVNTEGYGGFHGSFAAGDRSAQYQGPGTFTADMYAGRLWREFLHKQARAGFTWNRYVERIATPSGAIVPKSTSVAGFDSRYTLRGTDFALEMARSTPRIGSDASFPSELSRQLSVMGQSTGIHWPNNLVAQAEIRTLRVGTAKTGYLNLIPSWWNRGALWQNSMGGPNRDETGFNLNFYYLLPERAITLTSNVLHYSHFATQDFQARENYYEAYIEFVNGFTGKTYYRKHRETVASDFGPVTSKSDQWFGEVQVESRLAWLRVQSKVINLGTPDRKQLFAVENSINLTKTTKVYGRYAFGNDPSILRKGIFTQLQFRPASNVEMYLQYGPDYIGGGSTPVDDGNLQGGADQADNVKFILIGRF